MCDHEVIYIYICGKLQLRAAAKQRCREEILFILVHPQDTETIRLLLYWFIFIWRVENENC